MLEEFTLSFENSMPFDSNAASNLNSSLPVRTPERFDAVNTLLEQAVSDGVFPGAVAIVGQRGKVIFSRSVGEKWIASDNSENTVGSQDTAKMSLDTIFDIAALSGIVATTTIMMLLAEQGKLRLNERISRYVQGFGILGKGEITISQLLNHTSGLPAWSPFFEEVMQLNAGSRMGLLASRSARELIYNRINHLEIRVRPGTKQVFSDIGLIVLGELIEVLSGVSLDQAANRYVFRPLGMRASSYIDLAMIRRRGLSPVTAMIAPTEYCSWRERVLCGEVHDDNAWAMGGIAGHCGVFLSPTDLHTFASEMLRAARGESTYLAAETVKYFWRDPANDAGILNIGATRKDSEPAVNWRLGWDAPSRENGMGEVGFSKDAIGINGFTGCSLWLDPRLELDIIVMSNRVHPSRGNKKIQSFRPRFHRAVLEALTAESD